MLQVKNKYKNAYKNLTCKACQKGTETQGHVLAVCPVRHKYQKDIVLISETFSENPKELQKASTKILKKMDKLENSAL